MAVAFVSQMRWSRWEVLLRAEAVAKVSTDWKIWMRSSVGSPMRVKELMVDDELTVDDKLMVDDDRGRGNGGHMSDENLVSISSKSCNPRGILLEVAENGVDRSKFGCIVVG